MPIAARTKTPTRLLVLAVAGLAMVGLSACDSSSGPPAGTGTDAHVRQVTVVGSGKVEGTPDTVTVDAAIETIASDTTAALNQSNDRMNAVLDAVKNQGVDAKDISTTGVTLQPQYGDNSVITAYRANNSIEVKVRKFDVASGVITAIQTAGGNATRINSVNLSIEDDSQLVKDARAHAFNDAKDRAEQYAQLSGLKLGKVISISEAGALPPPPTPMPRYDAMAEAAVPIQPGQQTVGFSVTAVWELV
ncbi:DUF541 domain-containing protein [Mycolicibacterium sp. P9-64]|uniref:SIMPL domain-containing protein n=1 Tax=Mycolicibacterium sp. P9-64 TaxID=2024612 RepID=UPI0011EE08A9|nr:SIMPL domain-containing protein [Mycolicibacterium sp. P9-64]KAA0085751.1 DUF541 domain-containing protein [Mycolicibacterium sp. P9-64]